MNEPIRMLVSPLGVPQMERMKQKFRGSAKDWAKLRELVQATNHDVDTDIPQLPCHVAQHAVDQVYARFTTYPQMTDPPDIFAELETLVSRGHVVGRQVARDPGAIEDLRIESVLPGFDPFRLVVEHHHDHLKVVTTEYSDFGAPRRLGGKEVGPPRWETWRLHYTLLLFSHLWARGVGERDDWDELFSNLHRMEYSNESRGWGFVYRQYDRVLVAAPTAHAILDFLVTARHYPALIGEHLNLMIKRYKLPEDAIRTDCPDTAHCIARPLGVRVSSPSVVVLGLELLDSLILRAREREYAASLPSSALRAGGR